MRRNTHQSLLPLFLVALTTVGLLTLPASCAQPAAGNEGAARARQATPAPMRETRALWVTRFEFKTPDDVRTIVNQAASANFNVIFFQVRGQADALYQPGLEPWAATLTGTLGQDPGWDPLALMIETAHARGLQVHAWVNAYPAWQGDTPPSPSVTPTPMYDEFNQRYDQEWVQWTQSGPQQLGNLGNAEYLFANPAHPAVVDRIVAVCKDILTRYPVDGLQLDYIRYAGPEYSYDPLSNRLYAQAVAQNPGLSRADWQRAQVTTLVQRVRQEALPARPGARLTTTAWPVYIDHWGWFNGRGGFNAYFQDSQGWDKSGLVSAITPMLYGPTVHDFTDRFQTLAQDQVNGSKPGFVFLGIGADYSTFDAIAQRISIARSVGAQGQGFFSYSALAQHNYWDDLRTGPYSQPAQPNWP